MSKDKDKPRLFPRTLFIYQGDTTDDGEPVFFVAHSVEELPENHHGNPVGCYVLNTVGTFAITKQLT